MTSRRYDAVIFDLDGTLVDSFDALADAVNFARGEARLTPLHNATIRSFVGEGIERLLQRSFAPAAVNIELRAAFEQRYDEICCTQSSVLPDVVETLQALDADGISMSVCTNKPTVFSRKILEALGLAPFLRAIVGPDIAGARKPDAKHLLAALGPTGVPPPNAILVGDMPIDVAAARNAGIDVAVIATGSASAVALRESQPDYFLTSFTQLLDLVARSRT